MALRTWVARFVVDSGRVTEEGGRLRTFQRRRLDEPDVDLHVLCEPIGAKGDELGAQALDAVGRLFLQDRLSVTGGMLRALRSTHQTLLDWNRRSLPREQVSCGVAAAAVSGPIVYLAQAGPGIAFLRQNGVLRRLDPAEEAIGPLGEGETDASIRRIELRAGDLLLSASVALERILDFGTLEALLERGSDEALPELYLLTRDLPNFALFAVTCTEEPDAEPSDQPEPEFDEPTVGAIAAGETSLPQRPPLAEIEDPEDLSDRSAFELERQPVPEQPVLRGPPPLDISRPVVKLRSDNSIGRSEYARTTGSPRPFRINLADGKLIRLGVAAVLILLVIGFVPGLVKEGRSEKLGDLVVASETQLNAAAATADPAEKRRLLEDSRRLATEALRIDSNNTAAAQLRDQSTGTLKALDGVLDLGAMSTVASLSRQVTGDISLESLSVAGTTAYLLDSKGGRVLAVPIDGGQPAIVFEDGQTYGGTPAKKPQFLTWEGVERGGRLLILDAERKLFQLKPGSTPAALPLRRTNTWGSVGGIATYDGNLYVLDPKGNQIHRYLPAAAGFDSEPTAVLTGNRDIATAQGIAVDTDIYVILKDGRVRRFGTGASDFPLGGIDRALKAPTDISIVANAGEVYLADSGNKRVVVANKDGNFRRQYVSNSFTDLRAIAIDSGGAQLYVVTSDTLLTAPIVRQN